MSPDPFSLALPTEGDLNVFNSLDEQAAVRMFLGKTLLEAEQLFSTQTFDALEALMWMGPRGFTYYIRSAIEYLTCPDSEGDSVMVSGLLSALEFRGEHAQFGDAQGAVSTGIQYVLDNYEKFQVSEPVYGDLRPRYRALLERISNAPQ
jgi:hypothetical protein